MAKGELTVAMLGDGAAFGGMFLTAFAAATIPAAAVGGPARWATFTDSAQADRDDRQSAGLDRQQAARSWHQSVR
ncbi:hypothetical protein [Mesorhizobium sp. 131-3-5]|uniref:hypothetical protein n=1 Tax=Mesorhizobium sp. 131-3-5 TaxID=2744520 RepID=UPI0019294CE9|nr:hypothetical protein [Mesorhizobium sp. 131-3-5]